MSTPPRPMLYCILRAAPGGAKLQAPLAGLLAALPTGLRWLREDDLVAVLADRDPTLVRRAEAAQLQEYAELIGHLHRVAPLIPMRFGCFLSDDDAARALLNAHRARLRQMLEQVADCDEYGLRVLLPQRGPVPPADCATGDHGQVRPTSDDARPGHRHLAAVRRRLAGSADAGTAARAVIAAAVTGLYRDQREELSELDDQSLLSLYFLVERRHTDAFIGALRQLAEASPPLAAMTGCADAAVKPDTSTDPPRAQDWGSGLLSGPWPPYNFVTVIDNEHPIAG